MFEYINIDADSVENIDEKDNSSMWRDKNRGMIILRHLQKGFLLIIHRQDKCIPMKMGILIRPDSTKRD